MNRLSFALPGCLIFCIFLSPLAFAEEGLDVLTIHSVTAHIVSNTATDDDIAFLEDLSDVASVLYLAQSLYSCPAGLQSPPVSLDAKATCLGLAWKLGNTAYDLADGEDPDVAFFQAGRDTLNDIIDTYNDINGADELKMFTFDPIARQLFGGVGGRSIDNGQTLNLESEIDPITFPFHQYVIFLEEYDPVVLGIGENDNLGKLLWANNLSEDREEIFISSREARSLYSVEYSYRRHGGRHSDLSTFYKGIIDPPNLVTVEEPEAASGTVFAIDPLDTMLTTQLVSHGKSGHYRITPVSDLNVPNIGGTCGVGAYFEDSDFPGSYRYITEPITSPCTVEIRFAPKPPPPPPPTAVEDEFEAQEDSILTVSFPGVFQNDTYDNSTFVAAIGGGGEGGTLFGTLDFRTNGTFTYEPDINLCNTTDSFDYIILNGINFSGVVSVSIPITCVNDPPVITALPDVSIDLNSGPQSIDSFATAAPGGGADEIGQTFTWNIHEVTNGELFLTKPAIDGTGRLTYSLMPNISGTFTVTVTVTDSGDGNNTSAAQTFDIVVLPSIEIPTLPLSGLVLLVMLLGWFAVDVLRRRERSA